MAKHAALVRISPRPFVMEKGGGQFCKKTMGRHLFPCLFLLSFCAKPCLSRVRAYHSPGLASFLLLHGPFPFTVAKNISVTIWAAPFLFSSPCCTLDPDTHPLLKVVSVICIVHLLSFPSFCLYFSFLVPRNLHKKPSGILYPRVAQILSLSFHCCVFLT